MECFVVYSSPAGSTKKVAEAIADTLRTQGFETFTANLADPIAVSTALQRMKASEKHLLCIGSPVYACHAVPPVMSFIAGLSEASTSWAVPFVTWGCVTSGRALYEMAESLAQKGYRIAGAAALPAVHSLLWQAEHPFGEGRPDSNDLAQFQTFITKAATKMKSGHAALDLKALDYQPQHLAQTMQKLTLDAVRGMLPQKAVDASHCTQCGVCASTCPAAAITLSPFPVFGSSCFLCYQCVRICPEHAITADFSQMEAGLRQRAATFQEKAELKFFI